MNLASEDDPAAGRPGRRANPRARPYPAAPHVRRGKRSVTERRRTTRLLLGLVSICGLALGVTLAVYPAISSHIYNPWEVRRDRGLHRFSASFTYDGGHFSAAEQSRL
jgi:hypothetical protein